MQSSTWNAHLNAYTSVTGGQGAVVPFNEAHLERKRSNMTKYGLNVSKENNTREALLSVAVALSS